MGHGRLFRDEEPTTKNTKDESDKDTKLQTYPA